jgi:short subunit fatty acids transporter
MLQPVSALSVVAMAGIGSQRVLSYTVVTFLIAGAVNAAALLLLT